MINNNFFYFKFYYININSNIKSSFSNIKHFNI